MTPKTITPPPGDEGPETVKAPPPRTVDEAAGIAGATVAEIKLLRAERDALRDALDEIEGILERADYSALNTERSRDAAKIDDIREVIYDHKEEE